VLGVTTTHPASDLDRATWVADSLEQVQARVCEGRIELLIQTLR